MKKSFEKTFYGVLLVLLLIVAFLAGCLTFAYMGRKKSENLQPVPTSAELAVKTEPIEVKNQAVRERYVGYVRPVNEVEIRPNISGYIERVLVKGGDTVHQGDVLVVLDQRPYRASLASARADVAKANATYTNALIYDQRVNQADQAVSATEKDNAHAQLLESLGVWEASKAAYESAQVNLDYTIIRAPINGIVGDVNLTRGQYASPDSDALFSIVAYQPVRVVFSIITKSYLEQLKKESPFLGDDIELILADGTLFAHKGQFKYFDNTVDQNTASVAVYAEFDNIGRMLMPSAFAQVRITRHFDRAVSVPKDRVTLLPEETAVMLIRNGRLVRQKVHILASDNNNFIVADTFENGDLLVLENLSDADVGRLAHSLDSKQAQELKPEENN